MQYIRQRDTGYHNVGPWYLGRARKIDFSRHIVSKIHLVFFSMLLVISLLCVSFFYVFTCTLYSKYISRSTVNAKVNLQCHAVTICADGILKSPTWLWFRIAWLFNNLKVEFDFPQIVPKCTSYLSMCCSLYKPYSIDIHRYYTQYSQCVLCHDLFVSFKRLLYHGQLSLVSLHITIYFLCLCISGHYLSNQLQKIERGA